MSTAMTNLLPIDDVELARRIEDLLSTQARRYQRLWMYYRNPMLPRAIERNEQGCDRPYRQAQEWGLPSRVTGFSFGDGILCTRAVDEVARKEVVIENDIGWRIETMVDFLFGKPITITSGASDPSRRRVIEKLLAQIIENNGGALMLQQLATLGAVYGFVDVLVKLDPAACETAHPAQTSTITPDGDAPSPGSAASPERRCLPPAGADGDAMLARLAQAIRLEVIEPSRALPLLSESDWRRVNAYVQVYSQASPPPQRPAPPASRRWLSRILAQLAPAPRNDYIEPTVITEVITAARWQRFRGTTLIAEGDNSLGAIPLVHIQNLPVPFQYAGTSEVEQLAPLQDELNTRLSDRANRITMQSFKMYLGKGIENFTDLPVSPGRMWMTENENADIVEFGGESSSESEDLHITELREAMDKISGVTPIAAGAIRNRVGNLTSAAALRVTLMALLAKTERKRTIYGGAIARICELSLAWLDCAGLFHTTPEERRVEIRWPTLLPDTETERLRDLQIKRALGVPKETLLRELGYDTADDSPQR
jgi:hypothetical protein